MEMKSRYEVMRWVIMILCTLMALTGCAATRVAPPPAGTVYEVPWGAVPPQGSKSLSATGFEKRLEAGLRTRAKELRRRHLGQKIPYRILAISGGGSYGAFGAGILTGWTKTGDRPEFDVVTGISTGALMATFAFLGPEYDHVLKMYTRITNSDVFQLRGLFSAMFEEGLLDTEPLQKLLAELIDGAVLEAVAREYMRGRRLFIGTTNLDAGAFTIWDMGAIATSDRPNKLQRYRDVILASASIPGVCLPVYIEVDAGKESHQQMHVDGGVHSMVFYFDFVKQLNEAFRSVDSFQSDVHGEIYVIYNGELFLSGLNNPIKPRLASIAYASLMSLMRRNAVYNIYRIWIQALIHGFDIHIAHIPPEFRLASSPAEFDPHEMQRLFQFGEQQSIERKAWDTQRAVSDYAERLRLIDPIETLETLEARPQQGEKAR